MLFTRGSSCFMLLRSGFTFCRKRGFTFMKIILSSYYWRFTLLRRGLTFLEKGGSRLRKILYNIGEGFTLEQVHIF